MNRNLTYMLIAVGLGGIASLLSVKYINQKVAERTVVDHSRTVTVVVPVHAMNKGDILKQEDIATRNVPAAFTPADAVTPDNYETYLGQVLRAPLAQGAPLSASAIELVADHFSNVINKGDVAYTIQVDDNNAQSGLMVPGDHVDILLLVTDQAAPRIQPLESNVMVLATGRRAKGVQNNGQNADGAFSNVTLELTPPQAQRIAIAGRSGELRLMLREAGNNEPFNLHTMTKQELMISGQARKGLGVQFIIGGKG